jgi:uncharacterized caspase-like protein
MGGSRGFIVSMLRLCAMAALVGLALTHARAAAVLLDASETRAAEENRWAELSAEIEALESSPALGLADQRPGVKRVALVIGNDGYEELDRLNKAVSDSQTISRALAELGFEVTALADVGVDAFDEALARFYETIGEGDIAFFFFAGHGIASGGANYLLPVDMPAITPSDSRKIERSAIDATRIVAEITSRGAELAFVVLDACRDDPFPKADTRGAVRLGGLARMTPEQGAFVIYSAGAGQTALDRLAPTDTDPNSVFTRKFMPILTTPGMPIVEIAKRTQVEVKALADKVKHSQAPAYYDQVIGQFWFRRPEPKLYGLVVGIDEYNRERMLRGAANDARLVAEALGDAGAAEVVTAIDRDARPAFIDYVWRNLVNRAEPGDTVVFAYAGASFRSPAPAGSAEADGYDEYLALADSDWEIIKTGSGRPEADTSLSDDVVTDWMELAAAKNLNVVFLVDGCHGGGLLDREFANISFIGASAEDELVGEYEIGGEYHGAMSVAFADAVRGGGDRNGDGFVTQRELFAVTRADLFSMVRFKQTPQFVPDVEDAAGSLALFKTAAGPISAGQTR